jgi:radical SAM protein with 4Fe4S-binding SPASM domain
LGSRPPDAAVIVTVMEVRPDEGSGCRGSAPSRARLLGRDPTLALPGPRPLELLLDATNRCNIRCVMCHFAYESAWQVPTEQWTPEFVARVEREVLPHVHHAQLSLGTEPLMWKGFPLLLEACKRAGVPVINMYTNGLLLTEELAELIVATPMSRVQLSLEGASKESYEAVRVGGSFERFLRGVELLTAARARAGSKLPRLQFNITLLRRAADEVEPILRLARRLGVDDIDFRHTILHEGIGIEGDSWLHDKPGFNRMMARMRALCAELGLRITIEPGDFALGERPMPVPTPVSALEPTSGGAPEAPAEPAGGAPAPVPHRPRWSLRRRLHKVRENLRIRAERKRYRYRCVAHDLPARLPAGAVHAASVTLRNTGRVVWRAGAAGMGEHLVPGEIGLTLHVDDRWVGTTKLPRGDVHPGEEVTFRFHLRAPAAPGPHTVHVDLIVWGVMHFRDRSAEPLCTTLRVEAEPGPEPPACVLPWQQFVIRPDRTVVPCTFWYTTDRMGDLSTQSFEEIWSGPAYQELRRQLLDGDLGLNCARCPIRGIGKVDDEDAHFSHSREKADRPSRAGT